MEDQTQWLAAWYIHLSTVKALIGWFRSWFALVLAFLRYPMTSVFKKSSVRPLWAVSPTRTTRSTAASCETWNKKGNASRFMSFTLSFGPCTVGDCGDLTSSAGFDERKWHLYVAWLDLWLGTSSSSSNLCVFPSSQCDITVRACLNKAHLLVSIAGPNAFHATSLATLGRQGRHVMVRAPWLNTAQGGIFLG